ncbi:hypothetical protein tpqmel_0608 [Candidatus Gastranaerophilus sp. (ex Termes propinquus)]|nr:hypothetical protein tpqmel_0608 [Candidatus Gastranaerophilus sp. (ex Termes propinquus)]
MLDLGFDSSDKIIWIKSSGQLDENAVTRGFVANPDRVYFDIKNATLASAAKSWTLKNSTLASVRVSQFSTNPNVVRLVLEPKSGSGREYEAIVFNNQIIIKYSAAKIVENPEFSSAYKGISDSSVQTIFENTSSILNTPPSEDALTPQSILATLTSFIQQSGQEEPPQSKVNSRYYINTINSAQKGMLISGHGAVSLKPALYLSSPERMVVDIENAVLSPALRNKSFVFEQSREILRLGQFEKNVVRLVVEGDEAKNYRLVVSPDLQNIFVAKRPDVLNSKLTTSLSSVLSYSVQKTDSTDSLFINC